MNSRIEPIGKVPFNKITNQHYVQDYVDIPDFIKAQRVRANRWSIYAFFLLAAIIMALTFIVFDAAIYEYVMFSCVMAWWCHFMAKLHFSKMRPFAGRVFLAGRNDKLARVMWFIDAQPQTVQPRLFPLYAQLVAIADMAAHPDFLTQEHLEQMNEITGKIIDASGVLEK